MPQKLLMLAALICIVAAGVSGQSPMSSPPTTSPAPAAPTGTPPLPSTPSPPPPPSTPPPPSPPPPPSTPSPSSPPPPPSTPSPPSTLPPPSPPTGAPAPSPPGLSPAPSPADQPAKSCGISVYWGRNRKEGSLQEACTVPPLYEYVSIAFLNNFGYGQKPGLDLTGHCSAARGACRKLASEIGVCQRNGIKVLLSLGGPTGDYGLNSVAEAAALAQNLYYSYLGGGGGGPLGYVELDGVDLYIESPGSQMYWDVLADEIAKLFDRNGEKFYLSASAGCSYPDPNLNAAIQTGVFNSVSIRFYDDDTCDMSRGVRGILRAWNKWSDSVPQGTKLFMGLPADSDAATSGYVNEGILLKQILPNIKTSPNYGGIMLWNRYYDKNNNFGSKIYSSVCSGIGDLTFITQVV